MYHNFSTSGYDVYVPDVWAIVSKYQICLDAGDGSFKGERVWAAWPACDAPVSRNEEVTAADPQTAVLRAFLYYKSKARRGQNG